jgi:2-C-methyl-D-erythritol 4-phosphate cytidylyltransferase
VCHPDYTQNIPVNIIPKNIPFNIINGGETRNHSTKNAIDFANHKYKGDNIQMLFHDAARPNLKSETIVSITNNLVNYPVVVPVCKVTDTIYSLDTKRHFDSVINRNNLVKAYTPQGFQLSIIRKAYKLWEYNGEKDFSDDVSIVHHFIPEADIFFIEDNPWNLKLTYPEDIQILEYLLKNV